MYVLWCGVYVGGCRKCEYVGDEERDKELLKDTKRRSSGNKHIWLSSTHHMLHHYTHLIPLLYCHISVQRSRDVRRRRKTRMKGGADKALVDDKRCREMFIPCALDSISTVGRKGGGSKRTRRRS